MKYSLRPPIDSDLHAATVIAGLHDDAPCPKGGNPFLQIKVACAVLSGSAFGRECWERHRQQILAERKFLPGTRPKAWWRFDALPGVPQRWDVDPPHEWWDQSPKATQRAQAQWLHSRSLLTPAERRKLPAEWFAPKKPVLEVVR